MVKNNLSIATIVILTLVALVFGGLMFSVKEQSMAVYNMGRALVFSYLSIYLLLKPHKVDFLRSLKLISSGNSSEANLKVARVVSILFSIFNACISLALYFD